MSFLKNIEIHQGDITQLNVDAIVNAANCSLLGGGGVDGAIHAAAGQELLDECKLLGGCSTGEAKITSGYSLNANFVIHTVGPIWNGGDKGERELLKSCYDNSLIIAQSKGLKTIAFPNISTGIFRFPKRRAATIAFNALRDFYKNNNSSLKVIFAAYDDENYRIYQEKIEKLKQDDQSI